MSLKAYAKELFAPVLYRNCSTGLRPRRFYLWLDCLHKTNGLTGSVLEIGVASGGTAAFSHKFLRDAGDNRDYICIDTFEGFVPEQYAEDVRLGNSWAGKNLFSDSPMRLVRKVLDMNGAHDVTLIKSDISKVRPEQIAAPVSACLLDVDLAVPVYDGLRLIWPKLQPGGIMAIDDCSDRENAWKAIKGVERFCDESDLTPEFYHGMAYLVKV